MKSAPDVPEPSAVLERARDAVPITSRGLRELRCRLEGTGDPAERARLERILVTVRDARL
jgi:hypothetical protein